jgi:hypothetical protein
VTTPMYAPVAAAPARAQPVATSSRFMRQASRRR